MRARPVLTILMWIVAAATVVVGGLVAAEFILIPTALDPSEIIAADIDPWRDAIVAAAAFVGLLVTTIASLWFWHTARFWLVGLALMAMDIAAVAWVCARVMNEYF